MRTVSERRSAGWSLAVVVALAVLVPRLAAAVSAGANTGIGSPPPDALAGCRGFVNTDVRAATGFRFSALLPDSDFFASFSLTTEPAGTVVATPVPCGNRTCRYDVVVSGINISPGDCVRYEIGAIVGGGDDDRDGGDKPKNVYIGGNHQFVYPSDPVTVGTAPDYLWRFDAVFVPRVSHPQNFTFKNVDPTRTITLGRMVFSQAPIVGATPAERDSFAGASSATLAPGDSVVVPLTVPVPRLSKSSAIYVAGTMTYTGTGGGAIVSWSADHEEKFNPAAPAQSEHGLVAMTIALSIAAALAIRARRQSGASS